MRRRDMQITPLGDSALTVHVCDDFEKNPAQCLRLVLETLQRLEAASLPGVVELSPAYTTIGVFFDVVHAQASGLPAHRLIETLAAVIGPTIPDAAAIELPDGEKRSFEVEVCYEREFAPDLDEVARHAGMPADDVVAMQTAVEYDVHFVGFTPGFPYLGGLPRALATPRRSTPRTHIPAGSVAIGGAQLGIYPVPSPGGWNVIGRTAMPLFDARRAAPALLRAGDRLRFRSITADEFRRAHP